MSTGAARREQIQLELQLLRERQARERDAFDAVAAAHPELSAAEVTALARQQAEAAAPQAIQVDGAEVRVGDRVTVRDDAALLHRADRGFFGPDVLKPIYLGERGAVVRVMASFQGKPAVELRFADGVTKVFFTECIEVDTAGSSAIAAAAATSTSRRGDAADVPVFVPPPKATAPALKAETLPGWGQLAMPHRRQAEGQPTAVAPSASPPPPPATVSALRSGGDSKQSAAEEKKPSSPHASPPPVVAVAGKAPNPARAAAAPPAGSAKAPSAPAPQSSSSGAPPTTITIMKESPVKRAAAASPASPATIPIIRRPSSSSANSTAIATAAAAPSPLSMECVTVCDDGNRGVLSAPPEAAAAAEEERVVHSPSANTEPIATHPAPAEGSSLSDSFSHHVPQAGSAIYQAKYELQDETSRIPRRQSVAASTPVSGTRTCYVAGLLREDDPLTEPTRVAFSSQCTTMFSLFAVLTRKLQWDKVQHTASRLFTEKGAEVKTAGAVRDGMRLVATAGCDYRPDVHIDAFRAVPESRQSPQSIASGASPKARAAEVAKPPVAATAAPAATATPVVQRRTSTVTAASPAAAAACASVSPAHHRVAPAAPLPASRKPRHIRVYENGFYDDNVFRTVTVRPTYKSLVALKATLTRELQWRDGKRVDVLYDACGAEIVDLEAISDGDVVVASAGDRFVVPYPNTPMHQEAMKLSERLDPLRKC